MADLDRLSTQLNSFGVWQFTDGVSSAEARTMAQRIESLGYSALWIPEAVGRHAFVNSANLLLATDELVIATGIAGIHNRPAWSTKMAATELDELSGGRFILGLGVSHAPMVTLRGLDYSKPLTAMREYLDVIDHAVTMTPGAMAPIVLAALGPKMLELAAARTAGAHPYWTTPEHTAEARELVGPDAWLCVEQKCVLTSDREIAHARANEQLEMYISLPNYRNSWIRLGFTEEEIDGRAPRFVDAVVAWGD
ncbi:MAG: TIGR03620 family F420-dependent LLM class oxidoreductase, partial [Acidimicrobiales bacterium]|nr:TIGR03620 family F420-dependent LLM class oxidoreductase [Acidimicrobiales bacterium]